MSEMIAKVADAIESAYRNDDDSRTAMLRMARAAIEAMREPAALGIVEVSDIMREMQIDQLERLTGRHRLDIAVNGFPPGPLDRKIQSD